MQRDPETDYLRKSFALKETFRQNLLEMMSENLQLSFVQATKACKQKESIRIEQESKERWKWLIYFLLNIDSS